MCAPNANVRMRMPPDLVRCENLECGGLFHECKGEGMKWECGRSDHRSVVHADVDGVRQGEIPKEVKDSTVALRE